MKFMLMMHAPRGTGDYQINTWKPEEFRAHIQFMKDLNKGLREAGELVGAEGLAPPGQARVVRAQSEDAPEVTLARSPSPRSSSWVNGSSTSRTRSARMRSPARRRRRQARVESHSASRSRCAR